MTKIERDKLPAKFVSGYCPDYWLVVWIGIKKGQEHYRIFANWSGGYTSGDSWKLNSGIDSVEETDDSYIITGGSGSIYTCRKNSYGVNSYGSSMLNYWSEQYGEDEFKIFYDMPKDMNQFIYKKEK